MFEAGINKIRNLQGPGGWPLDPRLTELMVLPHEDAIIWPQPNPSPIDRVEKIKFHNRGFLYVSAGILIFGILTNFDRLRNQVENGANPSSGSVPTLSSAATLSTLEPTSGPTTTPIVPTPTSTTTPTGTPTPERSSGSNSGFTIQVSPELEKAANSLALCMGGTILAAGLGTALYVRNLHKKTSFEKPRKVIKRSDETEKEEVKDQLEIIAGLAEFGITPKSAGFALLKTVVTPFRLADVLSHSEDDFPQSFKELLVKGTSKAISLAIAMLGLAALSKGLDLPPELLEIQYTINQVASSLGLRTADELYRASVVASAIWQGAKIGGFVLPIIKGLKNPPSH